MSFKMNFKQVLIFFGGIVLSIILLYNFMSPYQKDLVNDLILCPQKIPYKKTLEYL